MMCVSISVQHLRRFPHTMRHLLQRCANNIKLNLMQHVEKTIQDQDARVAETAAKASALAAEAKEEVEELNRRRKRDKTSSDIELKALKKRLGGVFDNSDAVLKGIEHLYDVMQMMLESETMGASLEKQDHQDKKRIA